MELIKIKAWDNEIALISEISSNVVFELQDKKFNSFSPIKLEHHDFIEVSSKNIDELGLISDSISGAYGKTYFNKYYINELRNLCSEYGVENELVDMIFKDTDNIDKMFGRK